MKFEPGRVTSAMLDALSEIEDESAQLNDWEALFVNDFWKECAWLTEKQAAKLNEIYARVCGEN